MVNKLHLIGRLGGDPEVKSLQNGAKVAKFTLATSEKYKVNGERVEETQWHNLTLWRGLAEVAEKYLKKGDLVYIEGKIKYRQWEKDGVKQYTTEIVGDQMTMLSPKPQAQPESVQAEVVPDSEEDDLPF